MGNGNEEVAEGCEAVMTHAVDEDWVVECSDEESYNPAGYIGGVWEPKAEDIAGLYERLAAGQQLQLEWLCPGRRSPSPEKPNHDDETHQDEPVQQKQVERELPKGFDFDEDLDGGGMKPGFTPRRTPGSGATPRSQKKRVASMDNIMRDIMRHKKMEAAERKNTPGRRLLASPGQRRGPLNPTQRRLLTKPALNESPATIAPSPAPATSTPRAPMTADTDPFSDMDFGGPALHHPLTALTGGALPAAELATKADTQSVAPVLLPAEAVAQPPSVDLEPLAPSEALPDAAPAILQTAQTEPQSAVSETPAATEPPVPSASDINSGLQTLNVSESPSVTHATEPDRRSGELGDSGLGNAGGGFGQPAQPCPVQEVGGHVDTPVVAPAIIPAAPDIRTTDPTLDPVHHQPMPEPMATEEVTSAPAQHT